ncbi:hypothetical protein NL676_028129 [Syzygium grande]|nr:hypothetical protein NL676_028129 [Syzygium grande]
MGWQPPAIRLTVSTATSTTRTREPRTQRECCHVEFSRSISLLELIYDVPSSSLLSERAEVLSSGAELSLSEGGILETPPPTTTDGAASPITGAVMPVGDGLGLDLDRFIANLFKPKAIRPPIAPLPS